MEAEKDKEKLREKMVEELRSDKVQLQQQVAHLEELLRLQTMKELARDGKEIKMHRETYDYWGRTWMYDLKLLLVSFTQKWLDGAVVGDYFQRWMKTCLAVYWVYGSNKVCVGFSEDWREASHMSGEGCLPQHALNVNQDF